LVQEGKRRYFPMKKYLKKCITRFLAGVVLSNALSVPAAAQAQVTVRVGDLVMDPDCAWIQEDTTYVSLQDYIQLRDWSVCWEGEDVFLPLRVLAQAEGAELTWVEEEYTALVTPQAEPSQELQTSEDLYWLSRIISAESRGEPLLGQIAVGNVILNRVESREYPDSIKEVIFDRTYGVQFTPTVNGAIERDPEPCSVLAAVLALNGASVVGDSLYFFAPAQSAGSWITANRSYYTTIGGHRFYL